MEKHHLPQQYIHRSIARLLVFIMTVYVALSTGFQASAQPLQAPYKPTRALAPTVEHLYQLGEGAYAMGLCHDSIRWYKALLPFDETAAHFGIARCQERLGHYAQALKILDNLHLKEGPYQKQAQILRAHLLLMRTEEAQLRGNLEESEQYLRTFFNEHQQQRNHERYGYLMRQQASQRAHKQTTMPNIPAPLAPPLRVGLLLPLSGDMATIGQAMEQAALLALFNQKHTRFELYPEDTKGTSQGAVAAFERVLNNGVDVVLGPVLSANVKAIAPFSSSANIPVLAYSSDKSALINRNIRLFSLLPTEQARLMAQYGVEQKGLRVFSALVPDTLYGHAMLKAFQEELNRLGATFDRHAFFEPNTADLSAPIRYLTRMKEAEKALQEERKALEKEYAILASAMDDADLKRLETLQKADPQPIVRYQGLFVPAPARSMALIASQLAFYDSDGTQRQLLGTAQWDTSTLGHNAQNYLRNAIYPAQPQQERATFQKAFSTLFKTQPHPISALAYDSIHLIAHLAHQGLKTGKDLTNQLRQLAAYRGATGAYQILEGGTLRHGYSLMQLRYSKGKLRPREVNAAPFLLPAESPPLKVSNHSLTPTPPKKTSRFFGGLFGN